MPKGSRLIAALLLCVTSTPSAIAVECGDTITTDTVLDADLELPCRSASGRALTVVGPARLDLNGFRVRCFADPRFGSAVGIQLEGRRAEVSNGAVSECGIAGIVLAGSGAHVVRNVLTERSSIGFDVALGSTGNTLIDNITMACRTGFSVDGGKSHLVRNLTAGSDVGFELRSGAERTELIANVATGGGDGFSVDADTMNVALLGNASVGEYGGSGFALYGRGHCLEGNRAFAHAFGISLRATETLVSNNVAIQNEIDLADGFPDCDDNRWRGNVFTTSNQTCIR